MLFAELLANIRMAIEHDGDVRITRSPGIAQEREPERFKVRRGPIAQPVQSFAQRLPPLLVPAGPACIAAAIAAPALHSVHAAPGGSIEDLHLPRGGRD